MTTKARLDADRKAKPKTRIVQRVKAGKCVAPGNPDHGPLYHEAEDGSRTALGPVAPARAMTAAEANVIAAATRYVSSLSVGSVAASRTAEACLITAVAVLRRAEDGQ